MKKTEFNELIEKAFSLGYEYAIEEVEERFFSKDEDEEKEPISKIAKRRAIKGAAVGALSGWINGFAGGRICGNTKDGLIVAGIGAAGGSIVGAGLGASSALLEKIKRNPNFKYVKETIKDEQKFKRGEMSKEEFLEKYPEFRK